LSVGGAASWTAYPQKPIARSDCGADRRREQHRHTLGLAVVPSGYQALGILKHLSIGRATAGRFLFSDLSALIL
jgi:hypothetical protein